MIILKNILENRYYSYFMLFCIFCYAFFNIKYSRVGDIFLALFLIGSLPIFAIHKDIIFKNPIIIILIMILIAQVLSWINSHIYIPEIADKTPKLDRLAKLFVFFFIAYWLKANIKNTILLWLFFIFGFLFAIATNINFMSIIELVLNQQRIGFLIKNSQFDSMLAGTSLLMSLSFFYLTIKSSIFGKKSKAALLFAILLLIIFFTYIVLITQSRQVWLGLISAYIAYAISHIWINKKINFKVLIINFLSISTLLIVLGNTEIMQYRIMSEQDVVESIFIEKKDIEMSSVGIRINSWLDAKDWILKHPIIGLDSEAISEVIQQSKRFSKELKKEYGHLHNFFIETLVAYGFIGLLLIFAMYYFIILSIKDSDLSDNNKQYYLLTSISFLTYWLIINNFETFNSRIIGVSTHNIIFASFYTFHITKFFKKNSINN
ncbi:O-antigen ligase family protein [Sulfurimonas sp.]|uniref:O-antigen ligase family protein n=1 Tax=Sulfurimonas sp. TaxID=2022749 RepID=UPI0025DBC9D9|nr:O-antigen ligase family protein [Sulfurimonas sp.]